MRLMTPQGGLIVEVDNLQGLDDALMLRERWMKSNEEELQHKLKAATEAYPRLHAWHEKYPTVEKYLEALLQGGEYVYVSSGNNPRHAHECLQAHRKDVSVLQEQRALLLQDLLWVPEDQYDRGSGRDLYPTYLTGCCLCLRVPRIIRGFQYFGGMDIPRVMGICQECWPTLYRMELTEVEL